VPTPGTVSAGPAFRLLEEVELSVSEPVLVSLRDGDVPEFKPGKESVPKLEPIDVEVEIERPMLGEVELRGPINWLAAPSDALVDSEEAIVEGEWVRELDREGLDDEELESEVAEVVLI
jgi:hypothetical protein